MKVDVDLEMESKKRLTVFDESMNTTTPSEEEKMDVEQEMENERRVGAVHVSGGASKEKLKMSKEKMKIEEFNDEEDVRDEKKNLLFQDYEKTGSWGKVSKTDVCIIVVLAVLLIAGIITAAVFLVEISSENNDMKSKESIASIDYTGELPSSSPSSAAPAYMDPSIQLEDALLAIELLRGPDGAPIVDISALSNKNVGFFIGKFESPSASPLVRALSWILLDDQAPVGENWLLSRLGLVTLYFAWGGTEWTNQTNWLSEKSVCEWYGVTCDRQNSKVEELNLNNNNLTGSIPNEISLLTDMYALWLKDNHLSGTMPATALGSLPRLASLYLSRNDFTGQVEKALRNNKVLTTLHLDGNSFTGEWPRGDGWVDDNGKSVFNLPASIAVDCGNGKEKGLDLSRCSCDIHMSCITCTQKYCVLVFEGF